MHPRHPRAVPLLSAAIVVLLALGVSMAAAAPSPPVLVGDVVDKDAAGVRQATMAEVAEWAAPPAPPGPVQAPSPDVPPTATPTPVPAPTADVAVPADPVTPGGPTFPARIRGVWVHVLDDVLLTRGSIARMLDDVVAAGGNTVVVEVARRYDAYYDSDVLPRAADQGFEPGLDVLAEVVAEGHERGLSVHAWYTAMPAWTPETAKNPDAPVHWIRAQHGPDAPLEDRWLTYTADGQPGDYLDPGHPAVQELVVATAAELARYGVDAVHLDYLRYPGAEYGYNPTALGRFQAETGRTDVPAPDDPQFSDWRRRQTTDILVRIRQAVQAVDPTVGISAALIAWGDGPVDGRAFESTPAYTQVFQPWHQWVGAGLIDVAMPMLYFRESRHAAYHRHWMSYVAGLRQATGVMAAPGHGSWLNTVPESLTQLEAAAPFVDGEVLFSYTENAAGEDPRALLPALGGGLWGS
ncbi:glycoside hydrolase family 10 protein [Euzebya sp.]|uniref:glycoside hydrolase family 10 protein n=1 Tax=Euzebya sp. TaxID=1971409 RepID=UPI003513E082